MTKWSMENGSLPLQTGYALLVPLKRLGQVQKGPTKAYKERR